MFIASTVSLRVVAIATLLALAAPPSPAAKESDEALRKRCDANVADACLVLGLRQDTDLPKGKAQAAALYAKACGLKDVVGCRFLAQSYELGTGVAQDLGRAAQLYQQACDQEDGDACYALALMYAAGKGVREDTARFEALEKRGCELGSRMCQDIAHLNVVMPHEDSCEAGNAKACFNIGAAYDQGWEYLARDVDKAVEYFGKACDGSYVAGCTSLGRLYVLGKEVDQDLPKGVDLLRKACNGNDGTGCGLLGALHAEGSGVALDTAKARALYDKACRLNAKYFCELAVAVAAAGARPKPAATAAAPARPAAAAAATAAKPANATCKVARVQLGVDTVASVERDILARGGSPSAGGRGLAKHKVATFSGDYADLGSDVAAVNYDFDATEPAGRLVAVTIVHHATTGPGYEKLLASRKAAAAVIAGQLQQKSATEFVASKPGCQLRLLPDANTSYIYEVYQLPN